MKGDATKVQNKIDTEGTRAQDRLTGIQDRNIAQTNAFQDLLNQSIGQGMGDYSNIMGSLGKFAGGGPTDFSTDDSAVKNAIGGYGEFAKTGGFSPQAIQDLRARAIAPTRSIYAQAQNDLSRQRAINPNATNFGAAAAKMAREQSQAISDANVNANASIAGMQQQGRLAGMGGLANTGLGQQGIQLSQHGLGLQNRGQQLGALNAMSNLYGTSPGMMNSFGNLLMQSGQQGLGAQGLQNQLGLGLIDAQLNRSRVPSNFQQGLGNVSGALKVGGQIGRGLAGF